MNKAIGALGALLALGLAGFGIYTATKSSEGSNGDGGGEIELPEGTYKVGIRRGQAGSWTPIRGAAVRVGDSVALTDAQGYVYFLPAPGTYECSVSAAGYISESWTREIDGEHSLYATYRYLDVG